jgi:hypothetical protein
MQYKHNKPTPTVIGPSAKSVQIKPSNHEKGKTNANMIKGIYSFPTTKNVFQNKTNIFDLDEVAQEMPSGKKISPNYTNFSKDSLSNTSTQNCPSDESLLECNESMSEFHQESSDSSIAQQESSSPIGPDTLNYLVERERIYIADAYYLSNAQAHINSNMRAILLDWMMEVAKEYQLKRETYHLSVNYLDRYLSKSCNIQKHQLQLVGVTSLYIASKFEEIYPPKITDYVKSTDDGYSTEQIRVMEISIAKVNLSQRALSFNFVPPTINMWANWYMNQWDLYIESFAIDDKHYFKKPDEKSYAMFREVMQIVDLAILDIDTLQYQPRVLIASCIYLVLSVHYDVLSTEEVYKKVPYFSEYIEPSEFNNTFASFLTQSFSFELPELLPSIQYIGSLFELPFSYDIPQPGKHQQAEEHYEEFLSYQTHNREQLKFMGAKINK